MILRTLCRVIGVVSLSIGAISCTGGEGAPKITAGSGGSNTTSGTGGEGGMGGSVNSTGGSPGTGGASPIDSGSSGGNSGMGAGDASPGEAGTIMSMRRHGKSAGCGMAAAAAPGALTIPKCADGCSAATGNCPRDCIAPEFAPRAGGNVDFTTRPFTVKAPAGYDNMTAYPVFMGGGGCGSGGGGIDLPGDNGIHVALAIHNGGNLDGGCFADGGQACSGDTTKLALCVNSPEVPYVRAVLAWVETHYCVDLDKEFIGGSSSGAWEAYTNGCGDADQLRGFMANAGGKREHRWPCTGPVAAFMIANTGDGMNPITTKPPPEPHLDSYGSSAARDELLVRNGCTGGLMSKGTTYSAQYPKCTKYECPPAYPVVWCELGGGHTNTQDGGINYINAVWPFFMSLPPSP